MAMMDRVQELQQLREFFDTQVLPKEIQLSQGVRVTDVKRFIETHLTVAALPDPRNTNEPVWLRLRQLKIVLENSNS